MSIKNQISNWVRQSNWVRGSNWYYQMQRKRLYRGCAINYNLTEDKETLRTLEQDGICFIENFLPADQCDTLLEESMKLLHDAEQGNYPGYFQNGELQSVRIGKVDDSSENARDWFFGNKRIVDLAKAYVSPKVTSSRREVDFKLQPGAVADADMPHFDDWRHRFKAFLFLTDVGEDNGPMHYLKGSHQPKPWMRRYFREFERDGHEGRYGHFFWQEIFSLSREYGYEDISCLGKKGTLLLADFRGIHYSTPLKNGRRLIMGQVFEM